MASSSTRSTQLEFHLRNFYKIAVTRLHSSHMPHHANFVTVQFATLLDISEGDLIKVCLQPIHRPGITVLDKVKAEMKLLDELAASNFKMRRSDKLASAGNALADTGLALSRVGRGQEAARFCEWGDELYQQAAQAYDEEQQVERFWKSNSYVDDDVDMT